MRAAVILGGVILIEQGWSMTTAWANPTQSACALFTIQDINNALSVSVVIDQAVSGPDSRDGDNCVWNSSDGRNVMLRVAPLQDITKAKVAYLVETMNAYGGGKPAEDIKGLADDATYRITLAPSKGVSSVVAKDQSLSPWKTVRTVKPSLVWQTLCCPDCSWSVSRRKGRRPEQPSRHRMVSGLFMHVP